MGLHQQSTCGLQSEGSGLNSPLTVNAILKNGFLRRGRLNGKTEDVKSFNTYLDRVQSRIYDIFQNFISSGIEFDGERIKARYLGFDIEKPRMLLDIYEDHNKEFQELVGRGLSYRTLQKYKTIKGYVAEFLKYKYATNDTEISKLDYQFIKSFEIYLKTVKHCCHNRRINDSLD